MNLHLSARLAALGSAAVLTLVMVLGVNTLASQQPAPELMVQAATAAAQG